MHVLIVGDLCYVHTLRWAEGLSNMGVRISVHSIQVREMGGIRVLSRVTPPFRPWRPFRWLSRWRANFRRVLSEAKPDLIHVHFPSAYSVPLADIRGLPLVVSTWGAEIIPMDRESEPERIGKVALLNRANRILASSKYLAEATSNYAGLDPNGVQTLYWGVDLNKFVPSNPPAEGPVIGFAKAFWPKYGAKYLIEALPQVLSSVPDARVMMLGTGPEESMLRMNAKQLGVADAITWHGHITHEQMPDYYRQMALTVVPSVHESETLGVSALESQAMQVPVVASRIGGLGESVLDGETGLLVPPRDPEALASAIVRLLTNQELRTTLGQKGRRRVESQFDWRHTLEKTVEVYRELLQDSRNQTPEPPNTRLWSRDALKGLKLI
jgi:glycosyltransferase involved in cell wall biosynthesis